MQTGVLVQRKTIPAWALRLLVAALLLGPLLVAVDGLARLRRRREPVGRWTLWTLACALPFLLCALFAYLLGRLGIRPAAPPWPFCRARSLRRLRDQGRRGGRARARARLAHMARARPAVGLSVRPSSEAAGLSMLLVLLAICLVVWAVNPFTALLLLPALHVWLLIVSPELRPRPLGALALVALALLPLALLVSFYAHQLGLGPGGVAWTAVLLLAGGHVGVLGAMLWSLALGCLVAGVMLALRRRRSLPGSWGRSEPDRDHDSRSDVLRGPGLARRDRVGSATVAAPASCFRAALISGVYAM